MYDHLYNIDVWHSGDIVKRSKELHTSAIMSLTYLSSFAYELKNA